MPRFQRTSRSPSRPLSQEQRSATPRTDRCRPAVRRSTARRSPSAARRTCARGCLTPTLAAVARSPAARFRNSRPHRTSAGSTRRAPSPRTCRSWWWRISVPAGFRDRVPPCRPRASRCSTLILTLAAARSRMSPTPVSASVSAAAGRARPASPNRSTASNYATRATSISTTRCSGCRPSPTGCSTARGLIRR